MIGEKKGVLSGKLIALIIIVALIVLVFGIYGILSKSGTSMIEFFRDLLRFGR